MAAVNEAGPGKYAETDDAIKPEAPPCMFLLLNFSFTTLVLRFKMFIASKEVMIENVLNRFGRS